jgi:unconventional prefoldin RPB5 interactor 1
MAQKVADSTGLDRLRDQLEDSISKLRTTLKYWQTWEAEYEGFKEELELFEEEPSQEQMVQTNPVYLEIYY